MSDPILGNPGEFADEGIRRGETHMLVEIRTLRRWQEGLHSAFDLGFKAAGGTMIPGSASDMVELAINRYALDELATFAEAGENAGGGPFSPALLQFFENISIYRSRK